MDFKAINAAALESLDTLVHEIDASAHRSGREWVLLNPRRHDQGRKSFSINRDTGRWSDFAAGESGADVVSWWAYCREKSQGDAGKELATRFSVEGPRPPGKPWKGPKAALEYVPMHEAPEVPRQVPKGASCVWTYCDRDGRPLFQRPRFDTHSGKSVTWWAIFRHPGGRMVWKNQAPPTPRPLYGLPDLADPNKETVLIVEGEKAADAARNLFPRCAVLTSGGADSAGAADWEPLRGRRDVILWPDHDEPGSKYAGAVAAQLKPFGINLRFVEVPSTFPPKWDLADPSPVGPDELQRMMNQARPWAGGEEGERARALDVLRWSDLKDKRVPPPRWLWDPFFPAVPFGILASHPGHGKSLLSLQIAVGTATGLPVFGLPTCGPAGAGILALEDDQNVIHRRLRAIVEAYGPTWTPVHDSLLDGNLRVMVRARTPLEGLEGTAAAHHLATLARELGSAMGNTQDPPAVLFLDTLNAVHGGDENSNTEVRALTAAVFGLHDALGCSVWALHHLRKSGGAKGGPSFTERMDPELVRGAGALVGSARAVVQFGWILPNEAGKANLETLNSQRLYAILGLTKVNDGSLSPWLLLEHSKLAGLWIQTVCGDEALAVLRGGKAVEELGKAEALLLDVHAGLDRKALAEKHYPDDPKASDKLKSALQDLRRRHGWIQKGNLELTVQGFEKVKALHGRQTEENANHDEDENESWRESA